jgi:hypothetical protein
VDAELLVHVPEVALDGLGAQEQCGGGLPGCPPGRQGRRDLQFPRDQRADRGRAAPPAGFAGRGEFGGRPFGPRPGAEMLEGLQRGTNLLPGEDPVPGAAGLSLTIGTVLAAGAKPQSVTLNGTKVPYHLVATSRGNAVEVSVTAPAAQETLAVQAAG